MRSTIVTTLRNCALLAIVMLAGLPTGCSRDAGSQQLDRALAQEFSSGLPAVISLRAPSAVTQIQQLGCFPLEASPGAVLDTTALFEAVLDASDGGRFEWAIYSFDPGPDPLVEAEVVLRNNDPQDQLFIGIADFQSQAWDFQGPFSAESTSLPLDSATAFSGTGQVFIAAVAPLGSNFSVFRVRLRHLENDAPLADLQADTTIGDVPLAVNFDASGSTDADGSITKFEWDLNADGVFETDSGTTPTQTFNYGFGGIFDTVVRVTDDDGASAVASIPITVTVNGNVPPHAVLESDITEGDGEAGFDVNFTADTSNDPDGSITLYEWDLDGDGTFEESSPTPDAQTLSYSSPGEFRARLRVTDNLGLTHTSSAVLIRAHGLVSVDVAKGLESGRPVALAQIGKFPAIAYFVDAKLNYAVASTVFGQDPGDWDTVELADCNEGGVDLLEVGGKAAIAFSTASSMSYIRHFQQQALNPANWDSAVVDPAVSGTCSLTILDGRPAIAFRNNNDLGNSGVSYALSSSATGQDDADWSVVELTNSGVGNRKPNIAVIDGKPAICSSNNTLDVVYMFSSSPDGDALGDWQTVTFDFVVEGDSSGPVLASVAGSPGIVFHNNTLGIFFARSQTTTGGAVEDWQFINLNPGSAGVNPQLVFVDGLPLIASTQSDGLHPIKLSRSTTEDGAQVGDWVNGEVLSGSDLVEQGSISAANIQGYFAIAYQQADGTLRYVIRF